MIRLRKISGSFLLGLLFCSFTLEQNPLDKAKVVACIKTVGDNKVTVCDFSVLEGDEVALPLSMFTEELQIVKLDNKDEAFVKNGDITISDNYILVKGIERNRKRDPYKLFDKKGNFVAIIGTVGQGTGEYQLTWDQQIEESAGRIYIIPWDATNIWAYNLEGKYVSSIPLGLCIPRACFWVNSKDSIATIALAPIEGYPAGVYSVKTNGEVINHVKPGLPTFPNKSVHNYEPRCFKNTDAMDYFVSNFLGTKPDTLYHYDVKANLLCPQFTVNFPGENNMPIHFFAELPHHFLGSMAEVKPSIEPFFSIGSSKFYIIDKHSLKGSFFKFENDFLGGMEIGYPMGIFRNGYYTANMCPSDLKEALEEVLISNTKMTKEMRAKLTKLKDSITENDNNYILYAKLKK